jgi:glucan phosphorylase
MYSLLEESIVPTFYARETSGRPNDWIAMMRRTMKLTLSRYSTRRMLLEYIDQLYVPLLSAQNSVHT